MQDLVGPAVWFVGRGEGDAYTAAGASVVVESGALCRSRNAAIDYAQERKAPCVQLSDDLTRLCIAVEQGSKIGAQESTYAVCKARVMAGMRSLGAHLGGVAPTSNPFYANIKRTVHPRAFIVGDFIVVSATTPLRFDEQMTLKEDYDYTLQHIQKYGVVARRDDVLASFQHRKNPGGAVEARTPALEQENIAFLKKRWGSLIADNTKRPNEILLRVPRIT
jgi:hypothetical protein